MLPRWMEIVEWWRDQIDLQSMVAGLTGGSLPGRIQSSRTLCFFSREVLLGFPHFRLRTSCRAGSGFKWVRKLHAKLEVTVKLVPND
jgi:hypothetical protein